MGCSAVVGSYTKCYKSEDKPICSISIGLVFQLNNLAFTVLSQSKATEKNLNCSSSLAGFIDIMTQTSI